MSILTRALGERPSIEPRGTIVDQILNQRRSIGPGRAPMPAVDMQRALQHSAVFASTSLISDLVATLPFHAYREDNVNRASRLPRSSILRSPSTEVDSFETWATQAIMSLLLRGNVYGLVEGVDRHGWPTGVTILHPDAVLLDQRNDKWRWRINREEVRRFPEGPLWHTPGLTLPGIPVGVAPITFASLAINLGLQAEEFGFNWFAEGAHPSAVLSTDKAAGKTESATIKRRFIDAVQNREPVVLGQGLKYEPIQVAANESQFLETIKANEATVARFFRVPPEAIGAASPGASSTYQNVESRSLDLLTYTLRPWLRRLETGVGRLHPRGQVVRADVDDMVRVNMKARYESHAIAIKNGWRSPNEARIREGEEPHEGLDVYLWPPPGWSGDPTGDPAPAPGVAGIDDDFPEPVNEGTQQ